ncbi:MAG: 2,3-bisphosphoglycerate-independent phosphoglycerate mutase [Thermoanaerobaculia bacterium]
MEHLALLSRLARRNAEKIVLLVLDGVGDLALADQPRTALQAASTPHLDALAAGGSVGRIVPVTWGITPGSGPGHLALFGYDPRDDAYDIGRGVLEAMGLGLTLDSRSVAARANFATADAEGRLTDRRAGRIPTEENRRLCARLRDALSTVEGTEVSVEPGEGHRFVLLLHGDGLSDAVADTDPQKLAVPPREAQATAPEGEATAALVRRTVEIMEEALAGEPQANRVLLRGFSKPPHVPSFGELYGLTAGAFAGYPLYRGVAAACGMEVVECGKQPDELFARVAERWNDFDYLFLHVKQTDAAGEDGDLEAKVEVLERVDAALPTLLELAPDVVAVTGDHSTPAPMKAHSWHPVPVLISGARAYVDAVDRFDETAAIAGHLGTFPSRHLMGLLLAHAGKLAKYGA